jgi:hypothetical protein
VEHKEAGGAVVPLRGCRRSPPLAPTVGAALLPLDSPSTAKVVRDEHDHSGNENQVDQRPTYVAHETEQPQKRQNSAKYPQHEVSSLVLASRSPAEREVY